MQEDAHRGRARRRPSVPRRQADRGDHPAVQVPGPQHQRAHSIIHRGRLPQAQQRDQNVRTKNHVPAGENFVINLLYAGYRHVLEVPVTVAVIKNHDNFVELRCCQSRNSCRHVLAIRRLDHILNTFLYF